MDSSDDVVADRSISRKIGRQYFKVTECLKRLFAAIQCCISKTNDHPMLDKSGSSRFFFPLDSLTFVILIVTISVVSTQAIGGVMDIGRSID